MRLPIVGLLLACVGLVAGCGSGYQECGPNAACAACVALPHLNGRAMAHAGQRPRRAAVDASGVFTIDTWRIRVGSETRLRTDAVDGVPRLRPGTAVAVRARACHGSVALRASSIAPARR